MKEAMAERDAGARLPQWLGAEKTGTFCFRVGLARASARQIPVQYPAADGVQQVIGGGSE